MVPFKKAITVKRGDTKTITFRVRESTYDSVTETWIPGSYRNLTGWTVKSQIRDEYDSAIPYNFVATVLDQTTTPGGVTLKLSSTVSKDLDFEKGVWDCQMVDPAGDVHTYIEGSVKVTKDVTRD